MIYRLSVAAALLGLAVGPLALPNPALAQASPPAAAPATQVPESKVEAFSRAFLRANEVVERWEPQVEAAPEAQQGQLVEQANGEIAAAIEEGGEISVQEYQQIVMALQSDPALADRVENRIRQEAGQR